MKKFLLGLFIFCDLAIMGGSGYVLYAYLGHKTSPTALTMPSFGKTNPAPKAMAVPVSLPISTSTIKPAGNTLLAPAAATDSSTRKILFTYRNPHAKLVSIRADFTGWKAETMQKTANGVWTYQVPLTPGEYAYCYTADDKTFKDPANKRTKQIGRTLVSAILVESRPTKGSHP